MRQLARPVFSEKRERNVPEKGGATTSPTLYSQASCQPFLSARLLHTTIHARPGTGGDTRKLRAHPPRCTASLLLARLFLLCARHDADPRHLLLPAGRKDDGDQHAAAAMYWCCYEQSVRWVFIAFVVHCLSRK